MSRPPSPVTDPVDRVIEAAGQGRMFILVDDEGRENEGDLMVVAEHATPAAINFMARHGRGLVCLALPRERVEELGLHMMAPDNGSLHRTAFTVSIEAREGVGTGISAFDRARTIAVAIDPSRGARDLVSPGHVFPLVARDGGVMVRAGHTEAAVDIARLAGCIPAGVICEIMNEDGRMARLPELVTLARTHGLTIGTIADLIAWRRKHDCLVERLAETDIRTIHGGPFRMIVYRNRVTYSEHAALVMGDVAGGRPCLTRVHAINVLDDVLGSPGNEAVGRALAMIAREGRGVFVLLREPAPMALSDAVRQHAGNRQPDPETPLRSHGIGAQILVDLGVRQMILVSNTSRTVVGLDGYGLTISGWRPLAGSDSDGTYPSG